MSYYVCPVCGGSFRVPPALAGKVVRCRVCGEPGRVRDPAPDSGGGRFLTGLLLLAFLGAGVVLTVALAARKPNETPELRPTTLLPGARPEYAAPAPPPAVAEPPRQAPPVAALPRPEPPAPKRRRKGGSRE